VLFDDSILIVNFYILEYGNKIHRKRHGMAFRRKKQTLNSLRKLLGRNRIWSVTV
jgi:hypothetical protein